MSVNFRRSFPNPTIAHLVHVEKPLWKESHAAARLDLSSAAKFPQPLFL